MQTIKAAKARAIRFNKWNVEQGGTIRRFTKVIGFSAAIVVNK